MNDVQLRQLAEQHGFFGVDVWWAQNLPRFRGLLDATQARLTLTEAALSAAGELIGMSTAEFHGTDSAFVKCDYCNAEAWSGHEETCKYRQAKECYHAARDALK